VGISRAVGVVVVTILVLSACSSGSASSGSESAPAPTGAAAQDARVVQGRSVYTANCSRCHGTDGGGGVGPSFHGGVLLRKFATVDDQIAFVSRGKGVMPAFGQQLSRAEIDAVVRYEREVLSSR
jgi:mono/diheme cytochrome c family protein